MKKVVFTAVFALAALSFNSCKKDYNCECTSSNNQDSQTSTSSYTINDTKKNAEEACESTSSTATIGTYTATTTCELK